MRNLAILMATYNGGAFIREQIESIQRQTITDWTLIIRDDGSSDNTPLILDEFSSNDSRIILIEDKNKNLGPLKNFNVLMEAAIDFKYVMFSDQDDIWFEDKVELSLNRITNVTSNKKYKLLYTNYKIGDSNNTSQTKLAYLRSMSENNDAKHLLIQSWLMGCTMLINHDLLMLARHIPIEAINHDNWLAMLASVYGKIIYIDAPTMFHRIHSNNVTTSRSTKNFQNRLEFLEQQINNAKIDHEKRLILLQQLQARDAEVMSSKTLFEYANLLSKRGLTGILFALIKRFRAYNLRRTVLFFVQIMVW